jgi:hypothetical protein
MQPESAASPAMAASAKGPNPDIWPDITQVWPGMANRFLGGAGEG